MCLVEVPVRILDTMFCEQSAARVMSGKEKHNISRQILLSVWDSWSEYQHLQVVPKILFVDTICDVMTKLQSGDKISKCNQHFLVASKSQGVDKTCLWCQNSNVVLNCLCGVNTSSWFFQSFFGVTNWLCGVKTSSWFFKVSFWCQNFRVVLCRRQRRSWPTMKFSPLTRSFPFVGNQGWQWWRWKAIIFARIRL